MHQVKLLENVCKRELIEIVDVYVGNGVCVCTACEKTHWAASSFVFDIQFIKMAFILNCLSLCR